MTPGVIDKANIVMRGDGATVVDLPVRAADGMMHSEWTLTPEERAAVAAGRNIQLTIVSPRHPPVRVAIAPRPCPCCGVAMPEESNAKACEICAPLIHASMTAGLEALMREDPDLVETAPGAFALTPEAAQRRRVQAAKAKLDEIGRIALGLTDATSINPTLIASAIATLMATARE